MRATGDKRSRQVAVVTGGGRGIGAATAVEVAALGYAVCVNYRDNEARAMQVVAAVRSLGRLAIAVPADVSREADVVQLFRRCDEELGPVTALVNNAGVLNKQMRVEEMSAARIERVFAVNVVGSFLCAREAIQRMAPRFGGEGGAIVNVSSRAATLGSPNEYVDYAASKGAIDTLTLGLAKELASDSIRVNAVRPGLIFTEMHESGGEPGRVARLEPTVPLGRGGQPEEVARAIAWLLSDAASFVTGALVDVAGGR